MKIWKCTTSWQVPETSIKDAGAIMSHAAAENSDSKPSMVNIFLASVVETLYAQLRVPVIIQGELKPYLPNVPLTAVSLRQTEASPNYLNTWDITLWLKSHCDKLGVKRVVMVSYYPHYWRAFQSARNVGLIPLVPSGIEEIYDPKNSQWWARRKWLNRPYELMVRYYSVYRGWL
ncbi:MAG: hypothetical protein Q8P86_01545 [bacterium]|nr:hypothetical protein [bacterium]